MITQKELKELLHYNPKTGYFTWLKSRKGKTKAGDQAGHIVKTTGYCSITLNLKKYSAHRLAWLYVYGAWPKNQIDHINHNRLDNNIRNLRESSHKENGKNQSLSKNNKSGFNGVHFNKARSKWVSDINIDGKNKRLGYFDNLNDAIKSRKEANIKYNFHENHGKSV